MSKLKLNLKNFLEDYSLFQSSSGAIEKIDYRNLSVDSRTLKKGEFFVPLKGEKFDGHEFVFDAVKKKASGIVVQSKWHLKNRANLPRNVPVIVVEDTLDFLQKLATWHRSHFNIPIIAITGSNGKTTLRKMVAEILANKFRILNTEGNQNNQIGVPLTLLRMRPSHDVAIIELGTNHPGEIALLTELVNPMYGVITNIGKGHIGYFGSLEAIYKEKIALFDNMRSGSVIFKNMDDAFLKNYDRNSLKINRVGTSRSNDYWGKIVSLNRQGCVKFSINHSAEIQLGIPGIHHFYNALMAAAVGLAFDISIKDIAETLKNFLSVSQRMQMYKVNGVLIINDTYNANPDSTRAAIEYIANLPVAKGRKIIALGDMLEMGDFAENEHFTIGKFINGKPINYVFLYGPLSTMIKDGIQKTNSFKGEAYWYKTHEEIVDHLRKILAPNDVLLVKGSRGMKMENVLNNLFSKN